MEIICFVVPNWVAALQSHSTHSWTYSEISMREAQHKPNCCGSPIAEYTAVSKKHLIFFLIKNRKKWGCKPCSCIIERTAAVLMGWQSADADARGTEAHMARCGKPRRPVGDSAGRGEEAVPAADLPHGRRMWNRQRRHKMCCTPLGMPDQREALEETDSYSGGCLVFPSALGWCWIWVSSSSPLLQDPSWYNMLPPFWIRAIKNVCIQSMPFEQINLFFSSSPLHLKTYSLFRRLINPFLLIALFWRNLQIWGISSYQWKIFSGTSSPPALTKNQCW